MLISEGTWRAILWDAERGKFRTVARSNSTLVSKPGIWEQGPMHRVSSDLRRVPDSSGAKVHLILVTWNELPEPCAGPTPTFLLIGCG